MALMDSLGRSIGDVNSNLEKMRSMLSSLMTKDVGKKTIVGDNKEDKERKKRDTQIKQIIEKLGNFQEQLKEANEYAKELVDAYKSSAKLTGDKPEAQKTVPQASDAVKVEDKTDKNFSSGIPNLLKSMLKIQKGTYHEIKHLTKEATTAGTLFVRDDTATEKLETLGEKITHDPTTGTKVENDKSPVSNIPSAVEDNADKIRDISLLAASVSTALLAGMDNMQHAFAGVVSQELEFMSDLREIAFQTKGITSQTHDLQKEWENLARGGDVVATTGQHITVFQQQYIKALRQGVKHQKESISILKTGLNISSVLSSDVEATSELFTEWHKTLKFSDLQMAQLNRNLVDTAKLTGISGDHLIEAAKSSDKLIKNMRNAGTLTESAVSNITAMVASAKSVGVEDKMNELLEAVTSTQNLFFNTSQETQAFLFNAAAQVGRIGDLTQGTLSNTKAGMKDLARGIEGVLSQSLGAAGASIEDAIAGRLNPAQLQLVNAQLHSFGTSLNEALLISQKMNEASKTNAERLRGITKELENQNLTEQERLNLLKNQRDLVRNTSMDFMTKVLDQAKNADVKSIDQAFAQVKNKMSPDQFAEYSTDLSAVGISLEDPIKGLKQAAMISAKSLRDEGGVDFSKQLQKAFANKDLGSLRNIMKDMNEEQQKLAIENAENLDPLKATAFYMKKVNEVLRDTVGTTVVKLVDLLGPTGFIALQLGAILAAIWALQFKSIKEFTDFASSAVDHVGMFFSSVASGGNLLINTGKAILGVASKWILPVTAVVAAIGGIIGGLKAADSAAIIFNTTLDDVTWMQQQAAESAGIWTGMLNILTFGIFNKALGPTGTLTKKLAELFAYFPPLMWAFDIIISPIKAAILALKVLWGVIKGIGLFIKNVFVGAWEALKIAAQPLVEVWNMVRDAVAELWQPFKEMGIGFGETGTLVDVIANSIGALGTALGWVFKQIALVSKFVLIPIATALKVIITIVKTSLLPIAKALAKSFRAISDFMGGLWKVISGLFTLNWDTFKDGISNIGKAIFDSIVNIFWDLPKAIISGVMSLPGKIIGLFVDMFKSLYNVIADSFIGKLLGLQRIEKQADNGAGRYEVLTPESFAEKEKKLMENKSPFGSIDIGSIFPGLSPVIAAFNLLNSAITTTSGLLSGLTNLITAPFRMAYNLVINVISGITNFITSIPTMIGDGIANVFNILTAIPRMILGGITNIITSIPTMIGDGIANVFNILTAIPRMILNSIGGIFGEVANFITSVPQMLGDGLSGIFSGIFNFVASIPQMLWDGITNLFSGGSGLLGGIISSVGSWFGGDGTEDKQETKQEVKQEKSIFEKIYSGLAVIYNVLSKGILSSINNINQLLIELNRSSATEILAQGVVSGANMLKDAGSAGIGLLKDVGSSAFGEVSSFVNKTLLPEDITETPVATTAVSTMPFTTPREQIEQQKISENEGGVKTNKDLSSIADSSQAQIQYLITLHEDIQELINIFKSSRVGGSGGGNRSITKSNTRPFSTSNYHPWQFGNYLDGATRQVLNDGVS